MSAQGLWNCLNGPKELLKTRRFVLCRTEIAWPAVLVSFLVSALAALGLKMIPEYLRGHLPA